MSAADSPRKPVTAWEWTEGEDGFDDDPPFAIVTFHHGLGKKTRLDLSIEDMADVRDMLAAAIEGVRP